MNTTSPADHEFPAELEAYGWDEDRGQWWRDHRDDLAGLIDARPGRVSRVDRGECDVITTRGPERVVSGSQRAQDDTAPATGDWVAVADDPETGPVVAAVMPRRTAMVRRDPGPEVIEQVLAANVDLVVVVHGLDQTFSPARLERFLVVAVDSGAEAAVVLTKADLADGEPTRRAAAELTDAPVLVVASPVGKGIDAVAELVAGRTAVFIGLSGSGKSTLTNALMGRQVATTASVRDVDARGRHTTTRRELFVLPGGGVLIDTPGVRSIGLWDAWGAVHHVYADVAELADDCRFSDCTHTIEPGCAVTDAVADGRLGADRVARYLGLLDELGDLDTMVVERERRMRRGRRRR